MPEIEIDKSIGGLHIKTMPGSYSPGRLHRSLKRAGENGFDFPAGQVLAKQLDLFQSCFIKVDINMTAKYLTHVPGCLTMPDKNQFRHALKNLSSSNIIRKQF